jgi:hypothetical protein
MIRFDTDAFVDSLIKFDPYLTVGDIAFLMGKHTNSIYEAIKKGEIPVSTDANKQPRVKLSALLAWGKTYRNGAD